MRKVFCFALISFLCSCVPPKSSKLALDYLFCTHCSINEEKFKALKEERLLARYMVTKITHEEYTAIVKYAAYQYDNYFKPFILKTDNPFYNTVLNTTKKQYIEEKLFVYQNYRNDKLKAWELNIKNTKMLSRDSLLKIHDPFYNYFSATDIYFSEVDLIQKDKPLVGFCEVKLKNRWGYVTDFKYYLTNNDYNYLKEEIESENKIYPVIFTEKKIENTTYRMLNLYWK
jgi:hypothetical protein